jgi:hypothetical protein
MRHLIDFPPRFSPTFGRWRAARGSVCCSQTASLDDLAARSEAGGWPGMPRVQSAACGMSSGL